MVSCLNLVLICRIWDLHIRLCPILSRYGFIALDLFIVVLVLPKKWTFSHGFGSRTLPNWNATHLDPDCLQSMFGDKRTGMQFHTLTCDLDSNALDFQIVFVGKLGQLDPCSLLYGLLAQKAPLVLRDQIILSLPSFWTSTSISRDIGSLLWVRRVLAGIGKAGQPTPQRAHCWV